MNEVKEVKVEEINGHTVKKWLEGIGTTVREANGYIVRSWYEGIDAYEVEKDGEVLYHGWNPGDVIKIVGFDLFGW